MPPKMEQNAKAIARNKQNPERNAVKETKTPLKAAPSDRTSNAIAESGKMIFAGQKNEEVMSMTKLDEIIDSNAVSSLVQAIGGTKGDLMLSEIIIEFRKDV